MIAGILYQKLNEGFIDQNAFIVGLVMGLCFGVLELFLITKLNNKLKILPIVSIILIKTFIYTLIIYFIANVLGLVVGFFEGKTIDEFYSSLLQPFQFYLVLYSLGIFSVMIFFMQISRLLGEGVLLKFLFGKYNKPVEEERIFMFLDIKSSTTFAEKLGHKKFYSLLNTFFHHISEPVITTKAEIYQYVGDEVVFTWKTENGIKNLNCLQIFFLIKEKIELNHKLYLSEYGVIPEFKAGLHFGKVISAQIGDLKREIVFNGDVVNTTSRIQELCSDYNRELLVSGDLWSCLKDIPEYFIQENLGKIKIKGKEEEINIYSIRQKI
ncbi:adenylate/guanylate cyclase domain-containing protein [Bacteroidota bacterium]